VLNLKFTTFNSRTNHSLDVSLHYDQPLNHMIKFFRIIRQNSLMENKTGKYFKYAIGEIVLVVIGILIALSINNWNENQKNAQWEQRFLKDLRNELQSDLSQLNNSYEIQAKKGQTLKNLMQLIQKGNSDKKSEIDSVFVSTQFVNPTFFPTTGVYDSGVASGKIENIKNDSLKYMITNLYNHYYKRLVYNGEILDGVVGKVDWEKSKFYNPNKKQIKSWESVLDSEFYNQMDYLMHQNIVYTKISKANIDQIKNVINIVDKEINNND
jgi:hypothetical protein